MNRYGMSSGYSSGKNIKYALIAAFLLLSLFSVLSNNLSTDTLVEESVTVSGTVTDSIGDPVEAARILFICGYDTTETASDQDGRYTLTLRIPSVSVENDASEKTNLPFL